MIKEILLLHHTHTDIGYTSPQPVIFEIHKRFIEQAIDLVEQEQYNKKLNQFKWTCEVTGITLDWWKNTSNQYRNKFLKLHNKGLIDVAGVKWHMTPLMDHQMLIDNLEPLKILRKEGIKINYAMDCDINGVPWGMGDALIDHNIKGFSMAINEFYGHALKPWPSGFYWQTPTGRKILSYNGPIYGATASHFLKIPFALNEAKKAIDAMPAYLEKLNYKYDFFMAQITNLNHHDNAPPNPDIINFLKKWNSIKYNIPIRMVTISEFFEKLSKQKNLPTLKGDWSDWWNFGAGSTPNETRLNSAGQKALRQSNTLNLITHKKPNQIRRELLEEKSKHSLGLYAEHTWGADRSINKPQSDETRMQWVMKQVLAYEGLSIARMLRRDGMEKIAQTMGGNKSTTIAFNTLPYKIKTFIKIPKFQKKYSYLEEMKTLGEGAKIDFEDIHRWNDREIDLIRQEKINSVHRQDMTMSEISSDLIDWVPIEIDALSAKKIKKNKILKALDLIIKDNKIQNKFIEIEFNKKGGVKKIISSNYNFILNNKKFIFGVPVLEYPKSHNRNEIFKPVKFGSLSWATSWNKKWKNVHKSGSLTKRIFEKKINYILVTENYTLPNKDKFTIKYQLFTKTKNLNISVEINKIADSKPHALYLPLTINTGDKPECDFETAGATIKLDRDHLPFSCKHFITTQNWVSYHGKTGGVTIATKDCPLWLVGGLNYGKFDNNNVVERKYKMVTPWLYNNYWNTNFLADQSGLLKFDFTLNFEKKKNLMKRIKDIMPYVYEPVTHHYMERGKDKLTSLKLLNVETSNIYITDVKKFKLKSHIYCLNYSSKTEILDISSNQIKINNMETQTLGNKKKETILAKKGKFKITFKPHEWKIVAFT